MKEIKEIQDAFEVFLDTINKALEDELYNESKTNLIKYKKIVSKWYNNFNEINSLLTINLNELEFIDQQIFNFVEKYQLEDVGNQNYTEILAHYLLKIKRYWASEIKKGI